MHFDRCIHDILTNGLNIHLPSSYLSHPS